MSKTLKAKINANGTEITVLSDGSQDDYISISDIARYKNDEFPSYLIQNWMRNKSTVEFLGLWEQINNPNFNYLEFEVIKNEAGSNSFVLTPKKWVEKVNAMGIITKQGRYAATFAHKDIAFEFATWISAEFKLYIITDYQRLKNDENSKLSLSWNVNREIAKINYKIHTDAIKEHLVVPQLPNKYQSFTYATEADVLNVAMFGMTAKQWREQNGDKEGNIRDYATLQQLIVLSNMESLNAEYIKKGMDRDTRLKELNRIAQEHLNAIEDTASIKKLKYLQNNDSSNN